MLPTMLIRDVIAEAADAHTDIRAAEIDIIANFTRDPACRDLSSAFCFSRDITPCRLTASPIGCGIRNATPSPNFPKSDQRHPGRRHSSCGAHWQRHMFDHATGIVIGETAVVEDDVSVLHSVTLGGTGKAVVTGANRKGVPAGCKIIGNIEIGENAKVGAGSVVWKTYRQMPPWQGYRQNRRQG